MCRNMEREAYEDYLAEVEAYEFICEDCEEQFFITDVKAYAGHYC